IFRYLRDVRVYRCPEHDPHLRNSELNLSYAVNNYLNGDSAPSPKILKVNQVRRPSITYVTIDQIDMYEWPKEEDERSGIMYTDWTHWYIAPPAPRHRGTTCLSFVDGHVDVMRWRHGDIWGNWSLHTSSQNNATNADADMKALQA